MESRHTDLSTLEDYFKNTFQKKLLIYMPQREKEYLKPITQILEKRRELDGVEKAREAETEEFRIKMESLASRRDVIEVRESLLKESLFKFDAFIKENDVKLMRARTKAAKERDAINISDVEINALLGEKKNVNQQLNKLLENLQRHEKFHTYLRAVMKEGGGYGEPKNVLSRHETLTTLISQLRLTETMRNVMLAAHGRMRWTFFTEQKDQVMLHHNTVSKLQRKLELSKNNRLHWENEYSKATQRAAEKTVLLGKLRAAARNLYTIVRHRMKRPAISDNFSEQMEHVHNYLTDLKEIVSKLSRELPRKKNVHEERKDEAEK